MNSQQESFDEFLDSLDDDFANRVRQKLHDPSTHNVKWADDPDPFGLEWRWLNPDAASSHTDTDHIVALQPKRDTNIMRSRLVSLASLAATLVIGMSLGWLVFGRGTPDGGVHILAATAATSFAPPRGDEPIPQIDIESPIDGFATVIGLAPDRRQQVLPVAGGADIPVSQDAKSQPIELRAGTTTVVFAITPTPATEAVRRALDAPDARRYSPENAEELVTQVRQILEQKGHQRIALGTVTIDEGP